MNERFIAADAATVRAQIEALLGDYPEIMEDHDLLADMLDGSTDLIRVIERAVDIKAEADDMSDAIKARIEDMRQRRERFDTKAEAMKAIIISLMYTAIVDKLTLPCATISLTKARSKTVVDDLNELPQGYYKTERKPVMEAINATLDAGEAVPGAHRETGQRGLTIRVK